MHATSQGGGPGISATLLRGKRAPVDLERNPLLYEYYTTALNNYQPLQNLDNLDKDFLEKLLALKSFYAERSPVIGTEVNEYGKRNFDEIDRVAFGGLMKKALTNYGKSRHEIRDTSDRKRNFDEIDRAGFTSLKRNFDEIDRAGFNSLKRSLNDERPSISFNALKHSI